MKKTKLIASLLAIIMLMATMTTTLVSADGITPTANLTIENNLSSTGISIADKTYNLYQVFSATTTVEVGDGEDDAIEYYVNEDFYDFFKNAKGITYPTEENYVLLYGTDSLDAAIDAYNHDATEYINTFSTTEEKQELVTLLREYIVTNTIEATTSTSSYSLNGTTTETVVATDVSLGYYVVFDTEALITSDETVTTDIVTNGSLVTIPGRSTDGSLSANVTISLKGNAPTIEKEIWHNDRTSVGEETSLAYPDSTTGRWDEVADYQIGDTVEFRLTVEVPSDISAYETYDFIIYDTLSEGLELDQNSITIYTDAALTTAVSGSLHSTSFNGDDYTFKMDFNMINIKAGYENLDTFYIYYTATVTEDAAIYSDYEQNTVTLEYSNNPYESTSKGSSTDDVYGYTFQLDVTKTTGDGVTALADAVFALYEITSADGGTVETQVYLAKNTDSSLTTATYYPATGTASDTMDNPAGVITTDDTGLFYISGLDDSKDYVLKEINAPDGYNTADPIKFKITAAYSTNTFGIPTPTLTISGDTDSLDITVINTSANLLPETGGIGTTIFYIVGGVIMISALVLFVIKRRKPTVKYK